MMPAMPGKGVAGPPPNAGVGPRIGEARAAPSFAEPSLLSAPKPEAPPPAVPPPAAAAAPPPKSTLKKRLSFGRDKKKDAARAAPPAATAPPKKERKDGEMDDDELEQYLRHLELTHDVERDRFESEQQQEEAANGSRV